VKNEYTLHNSIVLAIFVPKIIKVGGYLTKFWQKQFWLFFETRCSVFQKTFLSSEPFAATLITHGTHGRSQVFVLGALLMPEGPKFEAEGRELGRGS